MTYNRNQKSQMPPDAVGHEQTQSDKPVGERDARGRFTRGNKGGVGNPYARRVALLRRAMLSIVKPDDMRAIIVKMILLAGEGDVAAARLVLQYTLGKASETVDPDRVDLDEVEMAKERLAFKPALVEVLGGLPPGMACTLGRTLVAGFEAELPKLFGKMLKEAEGTPEADQAEEQPEQAAEPVREEPEARENQGSTDRPPRVVSKQEQLERLLAVLFQLKPEGLTESVENQGALHGTAANGRGGARGENVRERQGEDRRDQSTVNKRLLRCDPDEDDELLKEWLALDDDSDG
jgi:hypothetical protein